MLMLITKYNRPQPSKDLMIVYKIPNQYRARRGGGAGGEASAPSHPFLKIIKSYWEKVFSAHPLWVTGQSPPPPHFQCSSAVPAIGLLYNKDES